MKYSTEIVLAHDFGTTGNKASLYTSGGKLLASHYVTYQTLYPQPGWAEQIPTDWKHAFVTSTKEVLRKVGLRPTDISAITFSAHMLGCIPVDQKGKVLREGVLLWADHRSEAQARFIEERIGWETFYHRTGGGLELALYPVAKLLWFKENEPSLYRRAYMFLGTKDYLVHWLTGRFVTDWSDASNTGMFDIANRKWASDLVEGLGLDMAKLPQEVLPSTAVVGHVSKAAAQETGLVEGIPVVLGGGDVPCAAAGAGVVSEGDAYAYIGSAAWTAVASSTPFFDTKMRPFNLCHVVPEMYVIQLATYSAGVVYSWFKEQLEIAAGKDSGGELFARMDSLASESPPGANGLLFLPHLRPGGAPFHDLKARGALLGLELRHTLGDILRAVLEGITINISLLCDVLQKGMKKSLQELTVVGGGAKSKLWLSILADVLGKHVVTLKASQETNCRGAAMVAFVGLGVLPNFQAATKTFVTFEERIPPDRSNCKLYRGRSCLFRKAYSIVSDLHCSLQEEGFYPSEDMYTGGDVEERRYDGKCGL